MNKKKILSLVLCVLTAYASAQTSGTTAGQGSSNQASSTQATSAQSEQAAPAQGSPNQPPAATNSGQTAQSANSTSTPPSPKPAMQGFGVEDGTPVKLRTARTISSADAHEGDTLDFEVLEDVMAKGTLLIPKGGIAWGP